MSLVKAKERTKKGAAPVRDDYVNMAKTMKVEFLFSPDGDVWVLHDKPMPEVLKWVEYDADMETVYLVTVNGRIMDVGLRIAADQAHEELKETKTAMVIYMKDKRIEDIHMIPMVVRCTGEIENKKREA